MDLSSKKTGDRLWTMLTDPDMKNVTDYLMTFWPSEVIYVSHCDCDDGSTSRVVCVVIEESSSTILKSNCLHDTRDEAIQQAIDEAEKRRDNLLIGIERCKKMLKK